MSEKYENIFTNRDEKSNNSHLEDETRGVYNEAQYRNQNIGKGRNYSVRFSLFSCRYSERLQMGQSQQSIKIDISVQNIFIKKIKINKRNFFPFFSSSKWWSALSEILKKLYDFLYQNCTWKSNDDFMFHPQRCCWFMELHLIWL